MPARKAAATDAPIKVKLGNRYMDTVSGFTGVATARVEYMNGCVRYEICAADKDGYPKTFVFDVEQLAVAPGPPVQRAPANPSGGDRGSSPMPR